MVSFSSVLFLCKEVTSWRSVLKTLQFNFYNSAFLKIVFNVNQSICVSSAMFLILVLNEL